MIGAVVFDAGELSDSTLPTEPGKTPVIHRMRMTCGPWPFRAYVVPIVLVWDEASRLGTCCAGSRSGPGNHLCWMMPSSSRPGTIDDQQRKTCVLT